MFEPSIERLGQAVGCAVPLEAGQHVARTWTIYADEAFLRVLVSWLLPPSKRIRQGQVLFLRSGIKILHDLGPLYRQMNMIVRTRAADLRPRSLLGLFASRASINPPPVAAPDAVSRLLPYRFHDDATDAAEDPDQLSGVAGRGSFG